MVCLNVFLLKIESVGMITPAEVDEEQHCFVGRAMVIRYKGEKHVSAAPFMSLYRSYGKSCRNSTKEFIGALLYMIWIWLVKCKDRN